MRDPPGDPVANMARDEEIADQVRHGHSPATLRIYRWGEPAITIGRSQAACDLPMDMLRLRLPIVRRPTGGRAVLHRLDELTYALAMPADFPSRGIPFRQIPGMLHRFLQRELIQQGFLFGNDLRVQESGASEASDSCFSWPVPGDLLYRGKKVAGAALRVWKGAILIQGSIQALPVAYPQLVKALLHSVQQDF